MALRGGENGASVDVEGLLRKARAGKAGRISVEECMLLKSELDPSRTMPIYCNELIQDAAKKLVRRDSRVKEAWSVSEGHGVRKVNGRSKDPAVDTVKNPGSAEHTSEIYHRNFSPEQQERIRRLHHKTASRGGKPRVPQSFYGDAENQAAVRSEVKKDLVRRESRREEMRK